MNMPKITFVTLSFLFLCSITGLAQDKGSVCTQVETSIRAKAPSWKLEKKSPQCRVLNYFKWTSGKSDVYAFVYPGSSAKEAADTFQLVAADDEATAETIKVLGTGLRELGDENRLWMTPTVGGRGVDFRKGKVVIRVMGSTMELALQFATYIADGLPAA